jgi:GDP-L-fucose synthase
MHPEEKIFVAGHNGLAGSAILRRLKAAGYRNLVTRSHQELDLCDEQAVKQFFESEKPAYVFLAAAKVGGIHANSSRPAEFIHQNLVIQTHVIHQSYLHGVKKLLFLGSSCIYPGMAPQPMRETCLLTGPLEPTNEAYAVAKIAGIQMCWAYNRQHGTRFIPLMPTNLYGPGDNFDLLNAHVLAALIRKYHLAKLALAKDGEAIARDEAAFGPIPEDIKLALGLGPGPGREQLPAVILWGSGTPCREFLFSEDLADACLFIMAKPWDALAKALPRGAPLLFNVGTGKELTIERLAIEIAAVVGYEGTTRWNQAMPDGVPRKLLDVKRLSQMGWQAQTHLSQGLRKTYQWYQDQIKP